MARWFCLLCILDFWQWLLLLYCVLVLSSFSLFSLLAFISIVLYYHSLLHFISHTVLVFYDFAIGSAFLVTSSSFKRCKFGEFGQEQLQMARKTEHPARRETFFKALMGDFSQYLRIPSAFIKNLNRRSMHICRLKGPSGQCWAVELEKRGNRLFFHKGWEEFVKHHPLEVGDFLIFSYDGVSVFDVTIYGKTFCEKNVKAAKRRSDGNGIAAKRSDKLPRRSDSHADKRRAVDDVEETSLRRIPFQSKNSSVCRILKTRTLYEVCIPTEVVIAEGLKGGMAIKIQDTFGMSWHLRLRSSHDRVLMRSGLSKICRANKTLPGDTVIFEFVKPRVVQLHIIRAGAY